MAANGRPRLAVWKLTSCDGCQLSLLDCEPELLALAGAVEIARFNEASSRRVGGPYDLSLVEGSVTTVADVEQLTEVRRRSRHLVTLGACATAGGIQALRNFVRAGELAARVYPRPELLASLGRSTPVSDHVRVDAELRGCPVDRHQLLEMVGAFLQGRRPNVSTHSVCMECKLRGTACVMVARGTPCLGPVTQAGCGAICPAFDRGCYGCFGPAEAANTAELAARWAQLGIDRRGIARAFRGVSCWSDAFRAEGDRHDA